MGLWRQINIIHQKEKQHCVINDSVKITNDFNDSRTSNILVFLMK